MHQELQKINRRLASIEHKLDTALALNVHEIRMIPVLGPVSESSGPVAPTPQFKAKFPVLGVLLMAFKMTVSQQCPVSVVFTDKKGNPATVDGVPIWLADNTDVLALTPAADGKSCLVAAVGAIGTGKITLTADADLGAGVTPVIGVLDVEITVGQAAVVTLTPGTPVEIP